jgi:hypothetical protein
MSAAEKHINKKDLQAYKTYEATNHSLQPGMQAQRVQSSPMKDYEESPSKKAKDIETTMKKNNDNLQHYSAMGSGVTSVELSFKLGQGGLLNQKKAMPNHIQSRSMSVM